MVEFSGIFLATILVQIHHVQSEMPGERLDYLPSLSCTMEEQTEPEGIVVEDRARSFC